MDGWRQDVRYAMRSLAGAKRFAAIVVATLALGIGANTAVFSVLNAVVLQPLPYEESERLVRIYKDSPEGGGYWPALALVALRDQSRTVDLACALYLRARGRRSHRSGATRACASVERQRRLLWRPARPAELGRFFERADERGDARLAVVSERIWRTYLNSAPTSPDGRCLSTASRSRSSASCRMASTTRLSRDSACGRLPGCCRPTAETPGATIISAPSRACVPASRSRRRAPSSMG